MPAEIPPPTKINIRKETDYCIQIANDLDDNNEIDLAPSQETPIGIITRGPDENGGAEISPINVSQRYEPLFFQEYYLSPPLYNEQVNNAFQPTTSVISGIFPESQQHLFFNDEHLLEKRQNTLTFYSNISSEWKIVTRDIRTCIILFLNPTVLRNLRPDFNYNSCKYIIYQPKTILIPIKELQRSKDWYTPIDPLIPCPMLQWLTSYLFEISNTQVRKVLIKDDLEIIL